MNKKKVFILGIDGAPPSLIFDEWLEDLPNIKKLMNKGVYGDMESSTPPLTCAAWTSFSTGKSSGDHGVFEYVYRKDNDFLNLGIISSKNIKEKTFWQILSEHGKKSIVVGVPITWPIKPFNGIMITGFMTPHSVKDYIYPENLKEEITSFLGKDYIIDIDGYRKLSKEDLIKKVYEMTDIQFSTMKYLIKNKEWDLFFGMLIGSDRMNHNFWRYFDKGHRRYEPNSPFHTALKEYYIYLDKNLGELLSLLDENTTIVIASDHGICRMHNRVNLADWLIKEGYLVLKEPVKEKIKLETSMIDWNKTKVFAIGAFEGQLYINLKGRDKYGIVTESEYDSLLNELKDKLEKIPGDDEKKLNTTVLLRKEDYDGKARDIAPDMVVYFDNLEYGCNASLIGNETLWSPSTAMGSDDAVHARKGIFIFDNGKERGKLENFQIVNVAKKILKEYNLELEEKKTKNTLICTVGPSMESEEVIKGIRENGMDYARINLSHVETLSDAKKVIDRFCILDIPTIIDTRGKEIRISHNHSGLLPMYKDEIVSVGEDNKDDIYFSREGVINQLVVGEEIFIDDHKIIFKVESIQNSKVSLRVVEGGELKRNRVVMLPRGKVLEQSITQSDREVIEYALSKGINRVALSFTETAEDVIRLRNEFPSLLIYSKIENELGVLNVDEIIEASDYLWIDRFDLGTFIGFEKVPLIQKIIIKKCRSLGKEIIIASHLLESMITEMNPTRAEINDISNTLLDGATGLALAAETAIGKDPIRVLGVIKKMFDSVDTVNHSKFMENA